jgi:hypothetical protein
MKLIINSNIFYKKALNALFKSLYKINFDLSQDIIVVVSQSGRDCEPRRAKAKEIIQTEQDHEITVIDTSMNNFEFTGLHYLNIYKNHQLIRDDCYIYVPDTVIFTYEFNDIFKKLKIDKNDILISTPGGNGGICCFGRGVVDSYRNNFKTKVNKKEAIQLEFGSKHLYIPGQDKTISSIFHFGNLVKLSSPIFIKTQDIYNTGHERDLFFNKDLGVIKTVLTGRNGDFHGRVSSNGI